eukprot:gene1176-2288_t
MNTIFRKHAFIVLMLMHILDLQDSAITQISKIKKNILLSSLLIELATLHPHEVYSITPTEILTKGLETQRIMNQASNDVTTNYKVADSDRTILLIPIIEIYDELENIGTSLTKAQSTNLPISKISLEESLSTLNGNKYQTATFKSIFNRYSDNIFYSDPNRANLYLGGGATPSSTQTEQYLLRNSILTSINDLRGDIEDLLTNKYLKDEWIQAVEDAHSDWIESFSALRRYLNLAGVKEVDLAVKVYNSRSKD